MQAVILLGGQGTRIRNLFPDRPKALIPVAGRPFLAWQLDWLRRNGITDVHLAAGHMGEAIRSWTGGYETDLRISVSIEPVPLGTAGAIRWISDQISDSSFIVVNGDTLVPELDLGKLTERHVDRAALGTIAISHMDRSGSFGTVVATPEGLVTAFTEKAAREEGWVNAGVYLLERDVLDLIPSGQKVSIETETFPLLVAQEALYAYSTPTRLYDMGTPGGLEAMDAWLKSRVD